MLSKQTTGLPNSINVRLITACLRTLRRLLSGNKHATIISADEPTITNSDDVKDQFYDDLGSVISAKPRTDKLILLGDFNARVGTDHHTWEGVIGSEGIGKCSSNDLLLPRKSADHQYGLPVTKPQQDIMDASSLQTLASH